MFSEYCSHLSYIAVLFCYKFFCLIIMNLNDGTFPANQNAAFSYYYYLILQYSNGCCEKMIETIAVLKEYQ